MSRVVPHMVATSGPASPPGEAERWRHAHFISLRLAMTLPFMALAPIFLWLRGAPSNWDALAFAFLLAPLAGVYALQRFARFDIAQTICVAAMVLLGVTLSCAHGALTVGAFACFLLAPLEAAIGGDSRLAVGGAALSLGAVAIVSASGGFGPLHPQGAPGENFDAAVVAAAMLYASLLGVWSARASARRDACASDSLKAYRELTETVGDLVLQLDRSGAVVRVVTDPVKGFRCVPADFLARGLFERILVSDRPTFLKAIWDATLARQAVVVEFRLRAGPEAENAAPQFVWVEMRAHCTAAAEGILMAILRDMTPMRETREALEAAREASERANLWKDRFLANVSHELRTPLNAIIGFSEMLGHPDLAPKDPRRQREYADIIHVSGQHLLSLVDMILDMSKIEAGRFEIEPEPFDLAELVEFCCDMVKLKADGKNIALTRACPPLHDEIVADKRACRQILLNILSNAVKFTPEGGKVALVARPDGGFVEIAVSDTGIGVTQNDLPRLGDPFFQARATCDRAYEGAGLGLSIVRGLVGLHGGAIRFESAPNEGACVTVRLPFDCRIAPNTTAHPAKIETLARRGRVAGLAEAVGSPLRPNLQVKKIA